MKWILLVLLLGFGGSIFYNKHLENELQNEEKRLKREDSRLSLLEGEVQSKKAMVGQQISQEQQYLNQLKAQLDAKQSERNSLADRLGLSKNFNDGDRRLSTTKWDMQHKKENITNLENQLKAVTAQRGSIEGQGKYSVDQKKISYQNSKN
jgi:chromosome segregation ATPase